MMRKFNAFHVVLSGVAVACTTGCGMNSTTVPKAAEPAGARAVSVQGVAHGGQQPLTGAHVYLYAVGTGGYGTASQSLLLPGVSTASDTSGQYYTTTDSTGSFSVTGEYLCTAGTQVYLYVSGGDPQLGSGSNTASGLMAGLGACPATKTLALTVPEVIVNEVSTVVMAYAFAGFAVDGKHIASTATTLAATGAANAMSTALNIVNVASGQVSSTTAVGNGVAPAGTIYTLANILASCINSTGPTSAACSNIQTLTGAATTADTAAIAIDIAHAPFTNVASLYMWGAATGPFQPAASTAPSDFTLSVDYVTPVSKIASESADAIAIDSNGNVVTLLGSSTADTLITYSPLGVVKVNENVAQAGAYFPLAIDSNNNLWLPGGTSFYEYASNGTEISPAAGYTCSGMQSLSGVAFDTSGHAYLVDEQTVAGGNEKLVVWQVDQAGGACLGSATPAGAQSTGFVMQVDSLGEPIVQGYQTYYNFGQPFGTPTVFSGGTFAFAMDAGNNLWSYNGSGFDETSRLGAQLAPAGGYSLGLSSTAGTFTTYLNSLPVIDGAGAIWIPSEFETTPVNGQGLANAVIAGITNAGVPITSPAGVYAGEIVSGGIAIDGTGNIWGLNYYGDLLEFIGLATPTATPVLANQHGTRP